MVFVGFVRRDLGVLVFLGMDGGGQKGRKMVTVGFEPTRFVASRS